MERSKRKEIDFQGLVPNKNHCDSSNGLTSIKSNCKILEESWMNAGKDWIFSFGGGLKDAFLYSFYCSIPLPSRIFIPFPFPGRPNKSFRKIVPWSRLDFRSDLRFLAQIKTIG